MTRRAAVALAILVAALAAVVVFRLWVGPEGFKWPHGDWSVASLEWELRSHRALSGLIVGASLGAAGVLLQSLLRNPLASPDLIGPSSGAALAVAIATYLRGRLSAANVQTDLAPLGTAPAALIGALAALATVYILSQRRGFIEPVSLILIGVIVSILAGAGTMLFANLMPPNQYFSVSRWTLGGISDETTTPALWAAGLGALACIVTGAVLGPAMDVAALSDDEARASGVNLSGLRISLFAGAGILTAIAVVLAGPIGFVGLVSPHIVRMIAGPAHRPLVIGAAIAGAALVLAADIGVRAIHVSTGRLPIGILTALVGGPVFIALLKGDPLRRGY
jgi:iron complex transport system permease protein